MNSDHNKNGPPATIGRRIRFLMSVRQQTTLPKIAFDQWFTKQFGKSGLIPKTGNLWPGFGVYGKLIANYWKLENQYQESRIRQRISCIRNLSLTNDYSVMRT
ncbi:hypothetical protein ACUNWD_20360 [Sunxiuqinia sp. A32]|uniref:hypothetical protein n=1 Tax=Sunxiuqinia sp. A32 TaxID=3461496 RepID=UPI004045BC29